PLAVGQPEQPLLEDGILAIPQGQREAERLLIVGDAGQPVLAPPIRARARVVVAEIVPGIPGVAVVLADRPPLPLGEIRPPLAPRDVLGSGFFKAVGLFAHASPRVDRLVSGCYRRAPGMSRALDPGLIAEFCYPRPGEG